MNKREVNSLLAYAYDVIRIVEIEKKGTVEKSFRSQISSFGAAISTGSLLSAIAFFSQQDSAAVDRPKLMHAILLILKHQGIREANDASSLFEYAKIADEDDAKEKITNATIALKLAMNLYTLV